MAVHADAPPMQLEVSREVWEGLGLGEATAGLVLPDAASYLAVARRWASQGREGRQRLMNEALARVSEAAPDWQWVAARLALEDLREQVNQARPREIGGYGNWYGVVRYLTDRGWYDFRLLAGYSREEVERLGQAMRPDRDLRFRYAGLRHLVDRYLVRDSHGQPVELPQEMLMGVAMTLALAEKPGERAVWALRFYDLLSRWEVTLATPTLRNARRPDGQYSSCFVDTLEDSLRGIFRGLGTFATVSKHGGGMGVYLGKVRAAGSSIQGQPGAAGGVIPWVRLFNDTAVSVDQLGQRAGAVSVWLDVWHKDILDFLDLKTNNGDARRKAFDVFPGVCVPDLFYRTVEEGGDWYLFDPHEVRKVMGFSLEDSYGEEFERRYRACVEAERLSRETIPAMDLMARILRSIYETGGPFIFHRDTANRLNPNAHAGMVYCSNLCTEIVQNQSPTVEQESVRVGDEVITRAISGDLVVCNLGSLNLGRLHTFEDLKRVVPLLVRMLDDGITVNQLPLPEAQRTNERYRAVGLGVLGYHEHLVNRGIPWESEAHVAYADALFEEIHYLAVKASCQLAQERGSYPLFPGSDWQTGAYFRKRGYTKERWQELAAMVARHGMRNGYLMAVAPTGSTSVLAGTTPSVDPVYRRVYVEEKRGMLVRQVAPGLRPENRHLYAQAHEVDQRFSIRAAAARQRHLDQSQSFNLYATRDLDEEQFLELYLMAWRLGLKTVYYFRSFDADPTTEASGEPSCTACMA
jgi:ribonucleoside-diphosphate reductase alpha chain